MWLSSPQASIDVVIDYDCYCSDAIISSSGEYWYCYWLRLVLLCCDYLVLRRVLMLLLITIATALMWLSRPRASIDVVIDYDCYCSDVIISSSGEYWCCYWLRLLLLWCDYLVLRRVLMLLLITIGTALMWLSRPQASIDVVIDYDCYCSGVIISSSGEYWWCYWLRLLLLCCDYPVLGRVLMLLLITIATALMWLSRPQASIDVVIDYNWYCSGAIISSSGEYWCCYWLRLLLLWCDYLVLRRVLMLLLITIATALMRLSRPQASIDVVIDYDCYCSDAIISSSGEYWYCYWLRLLLLCCDYLVLMRVLMLLLITIGTALMWLSRPRASIDIVIDYDWYCSGVIISSSGLRRVLMLLLITIATALVWLSCPQASIDIVIDCDCYCSGVIISSSGEYWCCYWLRLLLLCCDYLVLRRVLMLLLITIATALMRLSRPQASIDVVIDYDWYCSDVIISSSGEYWCCYWLRLLLLWCDYLVLRRVLMLLLITIATALMRLSRPQASIAVVIDYDWYCSGVIISSSGEYWCCYWYFWYCSGVIISSSGEYWCCYWLRLLLLWCDYLVLRRVLMLLLITIDTALVWLSRPQASIDVVIDYEWYCSGVIISSSGEYWCCYWLRLLLLWCDYIVLRRVLMLLLITIATALMWLSRPQASIDVVIDYDCYCSGVIISSSGEYWCSYWLRLVLLWCDYLVLRRVLMLLLITIATALVWLSRPQASIDVVIDYDCYCSAVIIPSSGEYWCCYWLRLLLLWFDYLVLRRVLMLLLITIGTALVRLSRPQASIDVVIDYDCYCSDAIISSTGEYWCCYWLRLLLLWCDYLVLRRVLILLLITIATALVWLSRPQASIDVVIDYDCYCSAVIISSSGEYWCCYWLRLLLLWCDYLVLRRVLMLLLITIATALMWLSRPQASIDVVIDYDCYCSDVIISSSGEYWCCYWLRLLLLWCDYLVLRRVLLLLLITIGTALVWLSRPQASIDVVIDYDWYCSGVIISSSGEYWCCYWLRLLLLWCDYLVLRRVLMLLLITIDTALVWLSRPQASIDVVIDYEWYCSGVIISSSGEYWCCYWLRLVLLWCDYLVLRRVLMLLLITIATALVWLSSHQASIDVVIDYDCYCSDAIIPSSGEYWCCYWLRLLLLWCDYLVLRRVLMLLLITIGTALVRLSRPQASIDVVIDYDCYCSDAIISSSGEYWYCYWLRLLLLCCDYLVLRRVLMLLLITIGTALMWLSRPRASIDIVIDYDWYCSGVII